MAHVITSPSRRCMFTCPHQYPPAGNYSITISPLACSFWLALNVCYRKACRSNTRCANPRVHCGVALPCASWCFRRPALSRPRRAVRILSMWSKCRCMSITVFSGTYPAHQAFLSTSADPSRNMSTTILQSLPVQQHNLFLLAQKATLRFSPQLRLDRGSADLRSHGQQTVGRSRLACCRRPGTPGASRGLAGRVPPATRFPQTQAEFRNIRPSALLLQNLAPSLFAFPR